MSKEASYFDHEFDFKFASDSNTNSPPQEAAYVYRTFDFELSVARPETKFSFTSKGSALCRP